MNILNIFRQHYSTNVIRDEIPRCHQLLGCLRKNLEPGENSDGVEIEATKATVGQVTVLKIGESMGYGGKMADGEDQHVQAAFNTLVSPKRENLRKDEKKDNL